MGGNNTNTCQTDCEMCSRTKATCDACFNADTPSGCDPSSAPDNCTSCWRWQQSCTDCFGPGGCCTGATAPELFEASRVHLPLIVRQDSDIDGIIFILAAILILALLGYFCLW